MAQTPSEVTKMMPLTSSLTTRQNTVSMHQLKVLTFHTHFAG